MEEQMNLHMAQQTYETVCRALDVAGWKFDKNDEELSVDLLMQGENMPIRCLFRVDKERCVLGLYAFTPLTIPEDRRIHVCYAANLINWRIVDGCYDSSPLKEGLLFRVTQSFRGCEISTVQVEYMTVIACRTVDEYALRFQDLAEGKMELADFVKSLNQ